MFIQLPCWWLWWAIYLVLADVSDMLIFNNFKETIKYDTDMFHGRLTDGFFSVLAIDSTTADNHESTLGTGSNYLKNETGVYTNHYSNQLIK